MRILFLIIYTLLHSTLIAQDSSNVFGTWEGKLNVGIELRTIFHFTKDNAGNISGTTDSPDQGVNGIKCSNIRITSDSVSFDISDLRASFSGRLLNDSTISGYVTQGINVPLVLKKVKKISAGPNRPQTPKPPFNYTSEDVIYNNSDKSIRLGATITIPKGKGPFPAVLLITGSGPQNRDEEIMVHKPFAVIADHLTRNGYVVLRVDDRGVGKSTGNFNLSTTADFAKDANTSLDYLKGRKEVDVKRTGIIGHSEGGMIAPMLAAVRKDIHFIILLAAPGIKISKLMSEQNAAILLSSGLKKEAAEAYQKLYDKMIANIVNSKDVNDAKNHLSKTLSNWRKATPQHIVLATTGITDDTSQYKFVSAMAGALSSPWYKYFLQFDPQQYLTKLNCKVLALNGDKDLQVISKSNLAGIRTGLKQSRSSSYEIIEIPGLNHLFQHCKKCNLMEYGQLEETFSPEVLQIITTWLLKNVK